MRKGYSLCWLQDPRLVTLRTGRSNPVLPMFSTEESLARVTKRIPIPPNEILGRIEIWEDDQGRLKNVTAGGGLHDMNLDRSRLDVVWDTDPGFDAELERGLAQLRQDFAI